MARKVISVRDLAVAWIYTLQQLSARTITDEGGRSFARVNESLTWICICTLPVSVYKVFNTRRWAGSGHITL